MKSSYSIAFFFYGNLVTSLVTLEMQVAARARFHINKMVAGVGRRVIEDLIGQRLLDNAFPDPIEPFQ